MYLAYSSADILSKSEGLMSKGLFQITLTNLLCSADNLLINAKPNISGLLTSIESRPPVVMSINTRVNSCIFGSLFSGQLLAAVAIGQVLTLGSISKKSSLMKDIFCGNTRSTSAPVCARNSVKESTVLCIPPSDPGGYSKLINTRLFVRSLIDVSVSSLYS